MALLAAAFAACADTGVYAGVQSDGTLHLTDRPPSRDYRWIAGDAGPGTPAQPPKGRSNPFDAEVRAAAARHGVDPRLVHAVIRAESGYDPLARSPKGALGLMQLMPATARRFGVADAYSVPQNVDGGTRYLRELSELFGGDLDLVLAAYNAGEGAVIRYGRRVPPYAESRTYVARVRAGYAAARAEGNP